YGRGLCPAMRVQPVWSSKTALSPIDHTTTPETAGCSAWPRPGCSTWRRRRARFSQRGIPMHRSSGQNRHARRPALEPCEERILQSIAVEPVGNRATPPQETAYTRDASRIVVLSQATLDHASGIFDDPFFFDAN